MAHVVALARTARHGFSGLPVLGVTALATLLNVAFALLLGSGRVTAAIGLVAGGAIALTVLWTPRLVLYGVVFINMVTTVVYSFVTEPRLFVGSVEITSQDMLLALVLVSWVAWELAGAPGDDGEPLGTALKALIREPLAWTFLLLVFFVLVAVARGGPTSATTARLFFYSVLVLAAYRVVTSARQLKTITALVVAGAVGPSLLGLYLTATGQSITERDLSTGGVRGVAISGSYLVAAGLLYVLASRATAANRFPVVWPALVLVLLGGVVASGARQTWLGTAAGLATFAFVSPVRGVLRMAAAGAAVAALAVAVYSVAPRERVDENIEAARERLTSVTSDRYRSDPSAEDRLIKWNVVWGQVKEQPVLGTGFGFTFTYTTNFGGSNFVRHVSDDPENTHLWVWARMGTVGFLAWVLFNLAAFVSLLRRYARATSPFVRSVALWGAGTLAVLWSGMAFSPVTAFRSTILVFWLVIALVPILRRLEERSPHASEETAAKGWSFLRA